MKKEHDIKLAFNASLNTHTLKRIVAYYYKEYIELDNKFENMTEDEYSKMMIAKIEKAKTKKERNKIAEEYAENTKKYYALTKVHSTLSFNNQVNRLNGYIEFKSEDIENQFELPLIDFISYNLNNINEYIIFFINFFDLVMDKLDKEDLDKIKLNTLYEIKFISELAKKYYDKVVNDVKKMQTIFKICIDLVYQLKINDYTKVLTKDLTKEQRFFLFNQVNNYPFKEIANNFRTINSLDYSYDYIDTKIPEIIVAIIKATDLEGKKISRKYKYETNNLYTAFYITLFNIISIKNWHIKICGNCGRYFLIQKENVSYCERITNKNETCKDIGSKEQQKRKLENQPIYARYRRIQQIKCVYASRYKKDFFFKNDYENFNKMANKFKSDIKKGEATIEEFDKWLDTQDKTKKQD